MRTGGSLFGEIFILQFESETLETMASAYKSAMRSADSSDSEASDAASSDQSSDTVCAESPQDAEPLQRSKKQNDFSQIPLEIRNRTLMLTSRGVSYR